MGKYDEASIVGERFGRLVAHNEHDDAPPSIRKYVCTCDCGNTVSVAACSLVSGASKSCGCLHRDVITKHGNYKSPTYSSWVAMVSRCTNPSCGPYKHYGGRGVRVCDRWLNSFQAFLDDMGERPQGTSIDRVNGSLLYSKETCKWSTRKEQIENRAVTIYVDFNGVRMTLKTASELSGIRYVTLRGRYARGLRGNKLFNTANLTSGLVFDKEKP